MIVPAAAPSRATWSAEVGLKEGGEEGRITATGYEPARVQQRALTFTFSSNLFPARRSVYRRDCVHLLHATASPTEPPHAVLQLWMEPDR